MSKQAITLISQEETFCNLSPFKTIHELNKALKYYKKKFADRLHKNARRVLEHIQDYSCKYTGVSFQTKNTIAKALGISRRTVIRVCKLFESLGIIKQYEMKRKSDMQQTSNAIVFQPLDIIKNVSVTQEDSKSVTPKKTIFLRDIINIKDIINVINIFELDFEFTASYVHKNFVQVVKPYIPKAAEIEHLWNRYTLALYKHNKANESQYNKYDDNMLSIAIQAFRQLVKKNKKVKGELAGYFYAIVREMLLDMEIEKEMSYVEPPMFDVFKDYVVSVKG